MTETSKQGEGFLPEVCADWETEAKRAESFARVVCMRIGVVLAKDGGALEKMLTPFKFGVGGKIGSGKQWMCWIALADIVSIIHFFLVACTGLGRDYSLPMRFVWNVVLPALEFLGVKINGTKLNGLDDSAKAIARLVTDSQYAGVTGKYFDIGKDIPSSEESYDRQKALDLWEKSAELVKLAPEETIFSKDIKGLPLDASGDQGAINQPGFSKLQAA